MASIDICYAVAAYKLVSEEPYHLMRIDLKYTNVC
jgi:hypothetical protein